MAGLIKAIVLFWPTFDCTWLEAARAHGDKSQLEFGGAVDGIRQPTHGVDKTDSVYWHALALSCLQHDETDEKKKGTGTVT
jgi:hypothetical protein